MMENLKKKKKRKENDGKPLEIQVPKDQEPSF